MTKTIAFFVSQLAAFLIYSTIAAAQTTMSTDLYTVRGISVSANAATALEARNAALASGQVRALNILINRLTAESASLPSTYRSSSAVKPMVIGYDVRDERRTATSYAADLSVVFDRQKVLEILHQMGTSAIESRAAPALVIPRLQSARSNISTFWYSAWQSAGLAHETAPLLLPSQSEMKSLENIAANWSGAVETLSKKYRTRAAIFVDADIFERANVLEVSLVAVKLSRNGVTSHLRPVSISKNLNGSGAERQRQIKKAIKEAAQALSNQLSVPWRQSSVVTTASTDEMLASLRFQSLSEWQFIRQSLMNVSLIKVAQLQGLSVTGAQMKVKYAGTIDQLKRELDAQNLTMSVEQYEDLQSHLVKPIMVIERQR